MEYCVNGSVRSLLEETHFFTFGWERFFSMGKDFLQGLGVLHAHNILHR
jgi:hypothetical protein